MIKGRRKRGDGHWRRAPSIRPRKHLGDGMRCAPMVGFHVPVFGAGATPSAVPGWLLGAAGWTPAWLKQFVWVLPSCPATQTLSVFKLVLPFPALWEITSLTVKWRCSQCILLLGRNSNIIECYGWWDAGRGEAQAQRDDIFKNLNKWSELVIFTEILLWGESYSNFWKELGFPSHSCVSRNGKYSDDDTNCF